MKIARRNMLKAGLAIPGLALAAGTAQAQAPDPGPRHTYVLIHGGSHGGWCWGRVADRLRAAGHRVYAPSLTGLADRSHLMSGDIDLDTHIDDIANLFRWEELEDAILVAHSYGGWPVTGALEKIGDRVAAVVYVDAFLPENGQAGQDLLSPTVRGMMDEALARGEVSRPPPPASYFLIRDKADEAWVDGLLTPQPIGVARQPITLSGALDRVPARIYIRAPAFAQANFDRAHEKARQDPGWQTHVVDCGHNVMIDEPDLLTGILLNARA